MRGANDFLLQVLIAEVETSPHAWSKHLHAEGSFSDFRNISTCVEQTKSEFKPGRESKKHLHMRGANQCNAWAAMISLETSPHAWSKQQHLVLLFYINTT